MTAQFVTHAATLRDAETTPNRVWHDLTPEQADGLACVICGVSYLLVSVPHRPVGRSETNSQVFACSWLDHDLTGADQ